MNIVTKASLLAIALSIGGSAYAQTADAPVAPHNYPVCSKSITDECINSDAVPHKVAHKALAHHHKAPLARHAAATAQTRS